MKKILSLTIVLACFSLSGNASGMYWDKFTEGQREAVYGLNTVRNTMVRDLSMAECDLDSAHYDPEILKFSNVFDESELDFKKLGGWLEKANLEKEYYNYASQKLNDLEGMFNIEIRPFTGKYKKLQNQEGKILLEDIQELQKMLEGLPQKVKKLFPENVDAAAKLMFPDYLGRRKVAKPVVVVPEEDEEDEEVVVDPRVVAYAQEGLKLVEQCEREILKKLVAAPL